MYSESEKEWILEAINHLKRRKARPDFSRISLRMKRKHQFTFIQTRRLLESLVESGFIVKAVYKNNTSYRDVSKWKKGRLGGQILNSGKMLKRFVNAIWANETDNKGTGVSVKKIEQWLSREKEDKCFLFGAALRDAIENEVTNDYLGRVIVDNEAFYTVNNERLKEIKALIQEKSIDLHEKNEKDHLDLVSQQSDSDQEEVNESQSRVGENNVSNLMMAICETESAEGKGSSIVLIKNWMIRSECFDSFQGSESLLLEAIESEVDKGLLQKLVDKDIILYAVNEQALDGDDQSDHSNLFYSGHNVNEDITTMSQSSNLKHTKSSNKVAGSLKVKEQTDVNAQKRHLLSKNPAPSVSLRPPSKRKRIAKDHGSDFETELPTKSKKTISEPKESTYPTPADSPVSEKSEPPLEQSFKFDFKKKRGRPKKKAVAPDMDVDEGSRQGGSSEQSSICPDDDISNDIPEILESPMANAYSWTAQKVADYFADKGYKEISEQMLEHEMDGSALGLLKRSDIVGPPASGMLKIGKLGTALKLFRDIRDLLFLGNADNYADPYEEKAFMRS